MSMNVKVEGIKDLVKKLESMKKSKASKILRKACTKGAQPVAKSAKAQAPVETGLLKKSIGHKVKSYPSGVVVGIVGPRVGHGTEVVVNGKPEYRDPVYYSHLVELGSEQAPPHPFLRPAWDQNRGNVENIMRTQIGEGIEKELAK